MHREERQIESDKEEPKMPAAGNFVEHATGDFRHPVVEGGKERKNCGADQHVMEVRHDEIGVMDLNVERDGREHKTG